MELYVIRHGIAEIRGEPADDFKRALTKRGRERAQRAAEGLARIVSKPDVILTSPKTRAKQTAAILGEIFDCTPQICDALGAESPEKIFAALNQCAAGRVMIVGHEPTLSELVEMLCTKGTAFGFIELKKSGCVLINAPLEQSARPGFGKLIWAIPPRVLRSLA